MNDDHDFSFGGGISVAGFQTSQEVYEVFGGFCEKNKHSVPAKAILAAYKESASEDHDAIVQFVYRRPDAVITWVVGEDGGIESVYGETDLKPEMIFEMDAEVANRFWQGKLDLTQAMATQQIKASGMFMKALQVMPHLASFYPRYKEHLKAIGREDLIEA
jgi:putative sterol carrier protein